MEVLHQVEISVLIAGAVCAIAVFARRLSKVLHLPSPAVFLLAGLLAATLYPPAHEAATFDRIATIGSFALIAILFEGGYSNGGWLRTGPCLRPIITLGLFGTLATTALLAAAGHYVVGFSWSVAVLIAVALAPTDPAAVFSVLGEQDVSGTTDIILEGESGANDPVGISLMIGAIAYFDANGSISGIALDFFLQLAVGALAGVAMGFALTAAANRIQLTSDSLKILAATAGAFLTFALATQLHGSGFLAVFIAGLIAGRANADSQGSTEGFLAVLAALSELALFTALGLTVSFGGLGDVAVAAIIVFLMLTLLIRPLVVTLLLLPEELTQGERIFAAWGGLKGAVPILLASFPALALMDDASKVYHTVFVVVVASVLVQGSTLPALARRIGVLEKG